MTDTLGLLAVLVALLIGLAVGKAWERYKLRDGRWIDRRKARESPHYILGLNFLVSNQLDLAIEELTKAAGLDVAALEIHLILGNLYREKGQVSKAIQIHQSLLRRSRLTTLEHAHVMLCLGLDFKRGGFVDRAFEAFSEVARLDPENQYALLNLENCTKSSTSGEKLKSFGSGWRRLRLTGKIPATRQSSPFLKTSWASKQYGMPIQSKRLSTSRQRQNSTNTLFPHTSIWEMPIYLRASRK